MSAKSRSTRVHQPGAFGKTRTQRQRMKANASTITGERYQSAKALLEPAKFARYVRGDWFDLAPETIRQINHNAAQIGNPQ